MTTAINTSANISALILAGGYSRRMGADKATLTIGEQSTVDIITGKLRTLTDNLLIVRRTDQPPLKQSPAKIVYDIHSGAGPLAGLESGLQSAIYPWSICIAIDMPFIQLPLLQYLVKQALTDTSQKQAVVCVSGNQVYPLLAVYHQSILPVITAMLEQNEHRLQALLKKINIQYVLEQEWLPFDPTKTSLQMLNTTEEYARICATLSESTKD